MFTVKNLHLGFPSKKLVEKLDFQLEVGELCAIIGRNGTGKTTLLRCLCGMDKPQNGEILLKNKQIEAYSRAEMAKQLALVNTERIRLEYFKVEELIALGRSPYTGFLGQLKDEDRLAVDEAIQATGIKNLRTKRIAQLSDGEHQKVMIARALAQETPVLLLDEPTAHLDFVNRLDVFHLLKKISREQGKTVLLSTHELDAALHVADKIIFLEGNADVWQGSPQDLIASKRLDTVFGPISSRFLGAVQSRNPRK